jgi:hypothetical protein
VQRRGRQIGDGSRLIVDASRPSHTTVSSVRCSCRRPPPEFSTPVERCGGNIEHHYASHHRDCGAKCLAEPPLLTKDVEKRYPNEDVCERSHPEAEPQSSIGCEEFHLFCRREKYFDENRKNDQSDEERYR